MQYPQPLPPNINYKKIDIADVLNRNLSRTTPTNNFFNPVTSAIADEVFHPHSPLELFDYSTNLLGQYTPEFDPIKIIGDRKSYFTRPWDFVEQVDIPVFHQDFELNNEVGAFYLSISLIHEQISVPYTKGKPKPDQCLTAIVEHTPARWNYWHFSIRWRDEEGRIVTNSESTWKNSVVGSLRAKLSVLLDLDCPAFTPLAASSFTKT